MCKYKQRSNQFSLKNLEVFILKFYKVRCFIEKHILWLGPFHLLIIWRPKMFMGTIANKTEIMAKINDGKDANKIVQSYVLKQPFNCKCTLRIVQYTAQVTLKPKQRTQPLFIQPLTVVSPP